MPLPEVWAHKYDAGPWEPTERRGRYRHVPVLVELVEGDAFEDVVFGDRVVARFVHDHNGDCRVGSGIENEVDVPARIVVVDPDGYQKMIQRELDY